MTALARIRLIPFLFLCLFLCLFISFCLKKNCGKTKTQKTEHISRLGLALARQRRQGDDITQRQKITASQLIPIESIPRYQKPEMNQKLTLIRLLLILIIGHFESDRLIHLFEILILIYLYFISIFYIYIHFDDIKEELKRVNDDELLKYCALLLSPPPPPSRSSLHPPGGACRHMGQCYFYRQRNKKLMKRTQFAVTSVTNRTVGADLTVQVFDLLISTVDLNCLS